MVAVSPLWVYYSQEARPYALSLTLVTGAYACAQRMVENKQVRWPWLIGYILCAAGSVLTHYYTFFVLLSIALILWKDRKAIAIWLGASAVAAIAPIIWLIWEWSSFSDAITGQAIQRLAWGPYLWGLGEAFAKGLPSPGGIPLVFMVVGLGLALFGALKRDSIPLVGWLLLVIVGIQIAGFPPDRPGPWVRYMISALPAFIMLEAIGIERLWKRRVSFGVLALAVVLGISVVSLWHVYFDPALARFDFRTPVAQLKASVRPDDRVIVNRGIATFFYYYGDTKPEPIILMPTESTPYPEIETQIAKASSGARVVYLIKYMPPDFDPGDTIEKWLNNHSTKIADQWVEHIRLIAYDFRAAPKLNDPGVQKVEANFGDAIQLIGWTIDTDLRANDMARITLFWKTKAKLPKDYKVFVHLVDASDTERKAGQHDSLPMMGAQPPTKWEPGKVITDVHPVVIPQGDWMLSIGMYAPDGPRLTARIPGQPDNSRVLLGPIHVP
jgi:hypothetical protein